MSIAGYRRAQKLAAAKKVGPDALAQEQMVQAREWINPSDFDEEPELARSAHLAYRYMNPYERTKSFYEAYRRHYTSRFVRRKGREPYRLPERLSGLESGDFTSIWRARQRADALGVPYERFIIAFMQDADDNGALELPRPNQLCGDEKLPLLIEQLDQQRAAGLFDPFSGDFDPRFYSVNFTSDQQQQAALDWMEEQIDKAGAARKPVLLSRYMCTLQVMSETEAIRRFGQELVDEAKSLRGGYTSRTPVALASPKSSDPGCFGMRAEGDLICSQCPALHRCIERRAEVEEGIIARFGAMNVPKERKRIAVRDRKRRQRERERSGVGMTDQERRRVLKEVGDLKVIKKREGDKARREEKKRRSRE